MTVSVWGRRYGSSSTDENPDAQLVLDEHDRPVVAHRIDGDVTVSRWTGRRWTTERVDGSAAPGLDTELALDVVGDRLAVGYRGQDDRCFSGPRVALTTLEALEAPELVLHRWSFATLDARLGPLDVGDADRVDSWPRPLPYLGRTVRSAEGSSALACFAVHHDDETPAAVELRLEKTRSGEIDFIVAPDE
ncbi:MAG: hypothetical protein AAF533_30830 [Acidobacteriota bacterium]